MEEVRFGAEPWKRKEFQLDEVGSVVVFQYFCFLHSAWHEQVLKKRSMLKR